MAFSLAYKRRIKDAFNEAAASHPYPDRPVVNMNGVLYTPNKIAAEVERETEFGRSIFEILAFFTRGKELDKAALDAYAKKIVGGPRA